MGLCIVLVRGSGSMLCNYSECDRCYRTPSAIAACHASARHVSQLSCSTETRPRS
jgi:hypothetical protein